MLLVELKTKKKKERERLSEHPDMLLRKHGAKNSGSHYSKQLTWIHPEKVVLDQLDNHLR